MEGTQPRALFCQIIVPEPSARNATVWFLGYLETKVVTVCGNVREYRGTIILPLSDAAGVLHSLQFIGADGTKRFLRGGHVAGCFFTIADKAQGPLVIAEGCATGASVHEATGFAVVCAMNAGNLKAVAEALRAKWPEREIVIAADNDAWTDGNPGVAKATTAAKGIGENWPLHSSPTWRANRQTSTIFTVWPDSPK